MLVVWWPVWVPPGGHTTTAKEDMVASVVAASATRKRNDGFIHGKPLVVRIC